MPEAVLILETEHALELQLNDVLSASGLEVYAADSLQAVLKALDATPFPLVVVDLEAPGFDIETVVTAAIARQPDAAVILTGRSCTASDAIEMMRAGAFDFVPKPFDPTTLLTRVRAALERRRRYRARLKNLERRARSAESAAREAAVGSGADLTRAARAADFADFALEQFLAIERSNMELQRKLRALQEPDSGSSRAPVATWIVVTDPEFAAGVASLGPRLRLEIGPPMSTGGEILDKISGHPPGIIVLDDATPDIPTSLVVETVRGEYPDVQLVIVDGWGTTARAVRLTSGAGGEQRRPMETVQDLIDVLEVAAGRASEASDGRGFAAEFRQRHDEFLRRVAELKRSASV
ncbi:MAG: response regulator [Myxococcales bacterium]|nr:response regulator [Myxococcales bacterium]MCB9520090.1 response regulator [Myxococcales bacterium]MCB9531816.1 response regulator [Myxococcales bacterium]